MSVKDNAEVDRILAHAYILTNDSPPKLLRAVRTSTGNANGAEGMAPLEGGNGRVLTAGDPCHWSFPCISQKGLFCKAKSAQYFQRIVSIELLK